MDRQMLGELFSNKSIIDTKCKLRDIFAVRKRLERNRLNLITVNMFQWRLILQNDLDLIKWYHKQQFIIQALTPIV